MGDHASAPDQVRTSGGSSYNVLCTHTGCCIQCALSPKVTLELSAACSIPPLMNTGPSRGSIYLYRPINVRLYILTIKDLGLGVEDKTNNCPFML